MDSMIYRIPEDIFYSSKFVTHTPISRELAQAKRLKRGDFIVVEKTLDIGYSCGVKLEAGDEIFEFGSTDSDSKIMVARIAGQKDILWFVDRMLYFLEPIRTNRTIEMIKALYL